MVFALSDIPKFIQVFVGLGWAAFIVIKINKAVPFQQKKKDTKLYR